MGATQSAPRWQSSEWIPRLKELHSFLSTWSENKQSEDTKTTRAALLALDNVMDLGATQSLSSWETDAFLYCVLWPFLVPILSRGSGDLVEKTLVFVKWWLDHGDNESRLSRLDALTTLLVTEQVYDYQALSPDVLSVEAFHDIAPTQKKREESLALLVSALPSRTCNGFSAGLEILHHLCSDGDHLLPLRVKLLHNLGPTLAELWTEALQCDGLARRLLVSSLGYIDDKTPLDFLDGTLNLSRPS